MTPGKYLELRRTAAGLSLDDVALMTDTTPPRCARDRAELLHLIEADLVPVSSDVVIALQHAFAFDQRALVLLVAIHAGADIAAPQLCRVCGCSWNDPCLDEHDQGCAWSADDTDLCTSCLVAAAEASFTAKPPVFDKHVQMIVIAGDVGAPVWRSTIASAPAA